MKKFISPGSWFAFSYPDAWFEFSEEPDCFLFYNPEKWDGNFRISAYRDASSSFGDTMMRQALKAPAARLAKVARWETVYSAESFTAPKCSSTGAVNEHSTQVCPQPMVQR